MQFSFNGRTRRFALSTSMIALLAACGGGGSGSGSSDSITLSGQVVDSAISGAQVCLYANGAQAQNAAGNAICSGQTDAQGNYTMSIPRNLASGLLTLVATKGTDIKLTSTLGTLNQVLSAAGAAGTVTPADLPSATVTHITTAYFALADTNNDGMVSQTELDAYKPDLSKVQKAATIIKAYIDGGQTSLIGGQTLNTLALASAVVQDKPFGSTGQYADAWFSDPDNVEVIAFFEEVNKDLSASLAKEMAAKFSKYQLTATVTQQTIPPLVINSGGTAGIFCGSDRTVGVPVSFNIDIAFDAARGIALVRYVNDDDELAFIKGSYSPQTGDFKLHEIEPKSVVKTGEVTYYSEGYAKYDGKIDSAGNIAGTFADESTTTWSLDDTRQSCPDSGTFTITKQ